MSNKANEELLNSLHFMTATKLAALLKEAEGDPDLMLRVLREVKGFLKDNNVSADISTNVPLRQLEEEKVSIEELPFEVEED